MKERKRRHLSIARDAAETGTSPARIRHGPGARVQEPGGFARRARAPPGARGGFVPMPRNAHA
ncbi:hypothetical protein AQ750_05015 [Burkholderia pseudomallei]|nr:hypothetical protein AQ750_05015 [Burkholderia pseudomallei]